jgi:hypothetical protein
MAFSYDLSTNVGKVRLNLGDKTSGAGPWPDASNFSDEELAQILTQEGDDVMRAVAACCEVLANAWSAIASSGVGPRREESNHVSEMYQRRAMDLRAQYGGAARAGSALLMRADGYAEAQKGTSNIGTSLSEYRRARQHVRDGW